MKKKLASVLLVSLLPACGGSDSPAAPPPPPPTTLPAVGRYSVSVTPDPIIASPSGDATYPWHAEWRVTIRDDAGLEGDVNRVVTTAKNNFGFTVIVGDYSPSDFEEAGLTNHIPRNGALVYDDGWTYFADGSGGQQLTLTIAAEVIDSRGNHMNVLDEVRVTALEHARLE